MRSPKNLLLSTLDKDLRNENNVDTAPNVVIYMARILMRHYSDKGVRAEFLGRWQDSEPGMMGTWSK